VQIGKQRNEGILTVDQRIVQGSQEIFERLIKITQNGKGVINTTFIERLNASFHLRLNNLVRRTRILLVDPKWSRLACTSWTASIPYGFSITVCV
jgi:hypothetical protein